MVKEALLVFSVYVCSFAQGQEVLEMLWEKRQDVFWYVNELTCVIHLVLKFQSRGVAEHIELMFHANF